MEGIIKRIDVSKRGVQYGILTDYNGEELYFDGRNLFGKYQMSDFSEGDTVLFLSTIPSGNACRKTATGVKKIDESESSSNILEYHKAGCAQGLCYDAMMRNDLKEGSGELEVIKKLKELLYITRVSHENILGETYPFCLIGATEVLKQFIKGKYEFLLVFSHFDNCSWQHKTLEAAKVIRKRKDIISRRPLVNFYILVSNAKNLKEEIDKTKGGTDSAIIPFSFSEILRCKNNHELTVLLLERFAEYLYENNMLGEENPIENEQLLFGDRGKIADAIVQRSIEGKYSGIFGLRRSGKSSVLRAAIRRFDTAGIKYVVIEARELEDFSSWQMALFDIAKQIYIKTSGLTQGDETGKEYIERLKLSSTEDDYQKRPSRCFVEDVKHYTKNEKKFVIAIDEIELITFNTATSSTWKSLTAYKGFWGALRDSGCSLIICGVNSTINEKNIIEYNDDTCDNPMYERIHNCADFSKTYLPIFTDEQTKTMINTLGGYSNIAFNNVYTDINRTFGGQPYYIRQFCAFLFEQIKSLRTPTQLYEITRPTFQANIPTFIHSKGEQVFTTILQHLSIYKDEYEMLKKFALSPEKYRKVAKDNVNVIDHLVKYGLIEYDEKTEFIEFTTSALKEYICYTQTKNPSDMNNKERRQYVQNVVCDCEKKLKKRIMNYYIYNAAESSGRTIFQQYILKGKIMINKKLDPVPDPKTCDFQDFFDHKKFIVYFSMLKTLIDDNWSSIGQLIQRYGMNQSEFNVYMDALNAGRIDADHYDPEDWSSPDEWIIDDSTMQKFVTAVNAFTTLFNKMP